MAADKQSAVDKAFASPVNFRTENGRTFFVRKWSIRKFTTMGNALSKLVESVLSILTSQRRTDYQRAVQQAHADGIKEGDETWPAVEDYEGFGLPEIVAAIPSVIQTAADELALIVSQSLTSEENGRIEPDVVLDEFTLDDLASAVSLIVEMNFNKSAMGKWKGLLMKVTEILNPESETASKPGTK